MSKVLITQYDLYGPGEIQLDLWDQIAKKYRIDPRKLVPILQHGKTTLADGTKIPRVFWEPRQLYFGQAVQNGQLRSDPIIDDRVKLQTTRIISWGTCNVHCPYCKRDCQFIGSDGNAIESIMVPLNEVLSACVGAHLRGEIVRFSGGDPVMFQRETLAIAEYMDTVFAAKVSIAHNGSGTKWVERLLPFLSSAAIDLKGTPEQIGKIMGIPVEKGPMMYQRSLHTQRIVSQGGVLLDVRTPVFGDTSLEDMMSLAADICSVNELSYTFWTWRLYKAVEGCDFEIPNLERVYEMMIKVSKTFPKLWLGVRAKWQRGGMVYIREGRIITASVDSDGTDSEKSGSGNTEVLAPTQ